jgi:hypothetical protein
MMDFAKKRPGNAIAAANHCEPHAILAKPFAFEAKKCADNPEDALHLLRGSRPVVRRERIERENTNAEIGCVFHNTADGGNAGTMASNARQPLTCGPAAIAVHNDGDMKTRL